VVDLDGTRVKLQVFDPCMDRALLRMPTERDWRGTHGVIIVYDITNRESFNRR
jgi:GTPase SAR1 family protein